MNPSEGVYDFSHLDRWLDEANRRNLDVLYTFARVPLWASSKKHLYCNDRVPNGECAPPNDLNADGTGTDQHWKDFVTAVVNHSINSQTAHINHYEIWNEPDTMGNWQGTTQQMVRMTADAAEIIHRLSPSSTVNSPAPSGEWGLGHGGTAVAVWMKDFLSRGGGQYVDAIGFHSYVWQNGSIPYAELVVPLIEDLKPVLVKYHMDKLPLWSTEGAFGSRTDGENGITDTDLQSAFTAKYLMLQLSEGVDHFFWFVWNGSPTPDGRGTLWTDQKVYGCKTPNKAGGYLCDAGVAYEQVEDWMLGASFTKKCAQHKGSGLWSCNFKRSGGYHAEAIWDMNKTCGHGVCQTHHVHVPGEYKQYRDIKGNLYQIKNHSVPVGAKPILLENQNP